MFFFARKVETATTCNVQYRSLLNSTSLIGTGGNTVLFCKRLIYCKLVLHMSAIT